MNAMMLVGRAAPTMNVLGASGYTVQGDERAYAEMEQRKARMSQYLSQYGDEWHEPDPV